MQYLRQFLKSPTGYKPGRQSPTEGDPPHARWRGYTNEAHLRGLKSLQAAEAAFVRIAPLF